MHKALHPTAAIGFAAAIAAAFCTLTTLADPGAKGSPAPRAGAGEPVADCAGCHRAETELWQQSHHARSMTNATVLTQDGTGNISSTVLGNFNNAQTTAFGLQGNFRTVDGYPVMALKRDDQTTHHLINFAFGSSPLQQYLTQTDAGRLQVLPFAWDSRPEDRGGQRWITLHPAEDIPPADRLHWQQPLANWNGMCADCHSTGLQRNYSVTDNSFATTYSAVNVSCGSCHGTDPHNNNPVAAGSSTGFAPRYPLPGSAQEPGQAASTPTTVAPSHAQNSKKTLEICAGCHSLRAPLVDGIDPTQPYLDQFSPTPLNPTLYFPDGQIREEVYVWGSFLQSRMHEQGVTCGNCHEPHSQQLKAPDNALCGQCHLTSTYDSATHHRHSVQSAGAQCVNCHMPSRTYMVVDDRRDHSFRVPNPATSAELGAPDPCIGCHQGRSQNWAAAALSDWRRTAQQAPAVAAPGNVDTPANRTLWQRNQAGAALSHAQLRMLSNDPELSELLRASMISRQAQLQADIPVQQLADLLSRKEPLIVLAAVQGSAYLSPTQRENLLGPLLTHNYRAVRIAAANQLRDTETAVQLFAKTDPAADNSPLARALMEADRADDLSSWRGEGAMNKALNSERSGDLSQAIEDYQRTIATDPYFEPAYINLTELYRRQGDTRREQLLYSNALQAIPQSPLLRYSYALHLVRRKNPAQALVQTAKALAIDPASQDNAYLHLLLLDTLGETPKGIAWLRANLRYHQRSIQLLQIGAQQAQKIGDTEALGLFMQRLRASQTPVLR